MTSLFLYDDARARTFEPFASVRPVSELTAGMSLTRHRWLDAVPADSVGRLCGRHLADFDEAGAPPAAPEILPAGSVIANSRCIAAKPTQAARRAETAAAASVWHCQGRVGAVRLRETLSARAFDDGSTTLETIAAASGDDHELRGWWLEDVWDFIRLLPDQLTSDLTAVANGIATGDSASRAPAHATVLGDHPVVVMQSDDAVVEPHVVLDATAGPIVIGRRARIRAFTRLTGPCYIGDDSTVVGGDITGCSIGNVCKVRGEISTTILVGHANKGHDGFIGHSYLGRWVNLGAGTVTSNLKNTYGTVNFWTPDGLRDTGMQFLGTFFGDHVKTGIGLRLTTGTVIGAGSNIFGDLPPKVVPPFSWGAAPPYDVFGCAQFLRTARRVMQRRHVELSPRMERHLAGLHAGRWTPTAGGGA